MCTRCITPLRFTPLFIILVIIMQFCMLGFVAIRVYADNFFTQVNTTRNGTEYMEEVERPEVGMYHVNKHTWYTIVGGIVVPFLSVITYFIINQYWLWQPLHYTGNHTSRVVPKHSFIESMTNKDKWIIFAFDPAAWIAMVILLASFIAFCVFASGFDYDGSIFDGRLPVWVYGAYFLCYIFMCFSFMIANIQTVAFGMVIYVQPCCCLIVLIQAFRGPRYHITHKT